LAGVVVAAGVTSGVKEGWKMQAPFNCTINIEAGDGEMAGQCGGNFGRDGNAALEGRADFAPLGGGGAAASGWGADGRIPIRRGGAMACWAWTARVSSC